MDLRDYQLDLVARLRDSLKTHRRIICQSPTGSGKTALAVYMMKRAAQSGRNVWFLVHRRELIDQTSRALWLQSVSHGVILPKRSPSKLPVQVASIQTLVRRLDHHAPPDLIIVDEAHRAISPTYTKIIQHYPTAKIIGLTATPSRTDGRGLGEIFDDIVCGPPVPWLIEQGYLSPFRIFAPRSAPINLDGLHQKAGDYMRDELAERMDRPTITGDAIREYAAHANGARAIVFCVSREHSRHVCEQFIASGLKAENVTGETPDADRRSALARFEAGKTRILCGVDLFIEGLDIPAVECSILLRPTTSLIIHLQSIGRVLRPAPGKPHALILDHVGNCLRHGLPDDDREWTLEGRQRKARVTDDETALNIRQCPNCFAVHRAASICPNCGHVYEISGRTVEQVDGALVELDRALIDRERRREQGKARGLDDLVALGIRRGFRHPAQWAANVFARRNGNRPTRELFVQASEIFRKIKREVA